MAQKTCDATAYLTARTSFPPTAGKRNDGARRGDPGGVEVVPRSLHCATAEGAVAPVGMTGWRKARRTRKRREGNSRAAPVPSRLRTSGMTIVRRTGKVVRGVKLAARLPPTAGRQKAGPTRTGETQERREESWRRWSVRAHPYKPRVGHPQVHLGPYVARRTQEHSQEWVGDSGFLVADCWSLGADS